jgi:hypothetical protein
LCKPRCRQAAASSVALANLRWFMLVFVSIFFDLHYIYAFFDEIHRDQFKWEQFCLKQIHWNRTSVDQFEQNPMRRRGGRIYVSKSL